MCAPIYTIHVLDLIASRMHPRLIIESGNQYLTALARVELAVYESKSYALPLGERALSKPNYENNQ